MPSAWCRIPQHGHRRPSALPRAGVYPPAGGRVVHAQVSGDLLPGVAARKVRALVGGRVVSGEVKSEDQPSPLVSPGFSGLVSAARVAGTSGNVDWKEA